ncbi:hypothetical protein BSR29_04285 [Boudabousia liubingyangii]|uniref:Uncharacterized protein n=1 Tax=Boudabousia liubingyangii TaxID=1921764 RepID=A0A1Q5PNG2_9ACTO|nr:hypothetical protein [Boudabousia liubingyangii]OKL47631.1 hypothetical protein BSR28_03855 [Boudabousia liubingyangii]OKL49056.1 hypothetical protein BSR29_04285 [Boudabousia liubingyangii]
MREKLIGYATTMAIILIIAFGVATLSVWVLGKVPLPIVTILSVVAFIALAIVLTLFAKNLYYTGEDWQLYLLDALYGVISGLLIYGTTPGDLIGVNYSALIMGAIFGFFGVWYLNVRYPD